MILAPSEQTMWEVTRSDKPPKMSDDDINAKYEKDKYKILTEMNREKLPSFAASLNNPDYIKIRSFYPRREGWDETQQSRLIQSFLINIPVPPIILYEKNYNFYEVIDGQQRIMTIKKFYDNKLKLTGLEFFPELNGLTYKELPAKIKADLDRRSIFFIVLLTESTLNSEDGLLAKQLIFEHINTVASPLSRQEVRHSLYSGRFDKLLLELSQHPIFTQAWNIPIDNPEELNKNNLYKKMEDTELILQFFALRNIESFRGKMEIFLDLYMMKSRNFSEEDIQILRDIFLKTIEVAHQIYEDKLFKPFDPNSDSWKEKPYKAYYEAVMVGFSNHLSDREILIERKHQVIEATKELFKTKDAKLFTGQGKTKADLKKRIDLFNQMLEQIIEK